MNSAIRDISLWSNRQAQKYLTKKKKMRSFAKTDQMLAPKWFIFWFSCGIVCCRNSISRNYIVHGTNAKQVYIIHSTPVEGSSEYAKHNWAIYTSKSRWATVYTMYAIYLYNEFDRKQHLNEIMANTKQAACFPKSKF